MFNWLYAMERVVLRTKQRGTLNVSYKTLCLWFMSEKIKIKGIDKYEWFNDEKGTYEECEITLK